MQVAVFHGDRHITIGEAPLPVAGHGEVLLKVRRTALCGSDTKLWLKGTDITPGHEIFGLVQQPGHALDGQRCLVYIPVHCGACDACRAGDTQMCLNESVLIGWNRPGGYAEYLTVPEPCLLPVPDDIEDDLAPLLLDTIGTAAHGIRFVQPLVPPETSRPVLVLGAGPVGMGALMALHSSGYTDLYVSDPRERRLQLAESFGAKRHPVGDTSRRFKLIVECSGAHAARSLGMEIVLPRGVLILLGENDQPWLVQESRAIRRKDFYMVRSFYFPKGDFALNLALLRSAKARYRELVDARFGIDQLPGMFGRFVAGELLKPMLAFA
ncbi:zinc-dependent alcohol dehydrogenase family protein [Verminephrobacter eiseniae]|uniref:zinc-dependent alcohol dehydrogenase family protein n=1 Tax=Verminephrobacter eiseniae TaxID=364317 RepID=UPI0022374B46|nr:zinc-binding dehydrogenase [Verminephrobacter eiseniae]MCW5233657.1 alcohol dehydrogenase [Verminephrobacter eiseniae]MCW5294788.1 alcohol dehydrogenase [Verminephrobacter eiseniae]MCW8185386.1 alcohol dehydrogenase [Verminephrobacter eiseniae]MCW8222038.1 alcohol dehydrogenase [Verminephrobacter eiseniae]MCW8233828.1 alcohol dehydrogenase [Verminephrobacter eiseniae]